MAHSAFYYRIKSAAKNATTADHYITDEIYGFVIRKQMVAKQLRSRGTVQFDRTKKKLKNKKNVTGGVLVNIINLDEAENLYF